MPLTRRARSDKATAKADAAELQISEGADAFFGVVYDPWKDPHRYRVMRWDDADSVPWVGDYLPSDCHCVFLARHPLSAAPAVPRIDRAIVPVEVAADIALDGWRELVAA